MSIEVIPLGAGQDVGRSCILVIMGGKRILFDVGMHMVHPQRFPDFSQLVSPLQDLTQYIDLVLVSHFHLDHMGALPFLTEIVGYSGPLVMTHPTKAIIPLMLEDFRKIQLNSSGAAKHDNYEYTQEMIAKCISKISIV